MQRQSEKQSVVWSTVMGFVLLGGVIPVAAAEDTKKPTEQAAPAAKKTPEKKATAKSGSQKAKPAATSTAPGFMICASSSSTPRGSDRCSSTSNSVTASKPLSCGRSQRSSASEV